MNIHSTTLAVALLGAASIAQTPETALPETAPRAMALIDRVDLMAHAEYLSRDELRGRLTGSPGLEETARYIAAHFEKLGLEPLGDLLETPDGGGGERGFLQRYPITRTSLQDTELKVGEQTLTEGFAVLAGIGFQELQLEGQVRFLGYGRTRGEDAEVGPDTDLGETIPVILLGTPPVPPNQGIEQQLFSGISALSRLRQVANLLARRGAKALVVALADDSGVAEALNYMALSPGKDLLEPRGKLRPWVEDGGIASLGRAMVVGIPTVFLSPAASARAFEQLDVSADALQGFVDSEGRSGLPGRSVEGHLALRLVEDRGAESVNVVAVLRGSDPSLQGEAVVFSAHMDHVGVRMDGDVFNGADDNASGTAGLMEIAQAFAEGDAPARSVIFLAVSGEEMGLWGSAWFAAYAPWERNKIAANINTDMIGRSGPDSGPEELAVTPSFRHEAFSTMVRDAAGFARALGIGLRNGDEWYERSDHYNFARIGVPVVFFCDGEHEDYHQVSDHADKLDAGKMERIARLAFWTGYQVANSPDRPRRLGPQRRW